LYAINGNRTAIQNNSIARNGHDAPEQGVAGIQGVVKNNNVPAFPHAGIRYC